MSRFSDLFQEPKIDSSPVPVSTPVPDPEPVKVEKIAVKKPAVIHQPPQKKLTTD